MGSVIWEVDWGNDGFGRPNVLFATQPEKRRMLGMKMLGLLVLAAIVALAFGYVGPPLGIAPFVQSQLGYNFGAGGTTVSALPFAFPIAGLIAALIVIALVTGKAFYTGDNRDTWRKRQVLESNKMMSSFFVMIAGISARARDMLGLVTPARRLKSIGAA